MNEIESESISNRNFAEKDDNFGQFKQEIDDN